MQNYNINTAKTQLNAAIVDINNLQDQINNLNGTLDMSALSENIQNNHDITHILIEQKKEVERLMNMLNSGKFASHNELNMLTNQVSDLRKAIASTAETITEQTETLATENYLDEDSESRSVVELKLDALAPIASNTESLTETFDPTEAETIQVIQRPAKFLPKAQAQKQADIRTYNSKNSGKNKQTKIITINLPAQQLIESKNNLKQIQDQPKKSNPIKHAKPVRSNWVYYCKFS